MSTYPMFSRPPRVRKGWLRRVELVASVLGVVLIIGASMLAFAFIQEKNHATIGRKTPVPTHSTRTVQPTGTTSLPLVPGEKRTLVGNDAQLADQSSFIATAQVIWVRQGQPGTDDGAILRTTDGGKHWQRVTLPQALSGHRFEVHVFDDNMAFIVPLPDKPDSAQSSLYRTLDGGTSWQRGTLPALASNNGLGIRFSWSFLDHQQGWMTTLNRACCGGDDRRNTLATSGGEMLYHTTDGGLTWLPIISLPFKYRAQNPTFINARTGWLISYVDDLAHTALDDVLAFPAILYVTHDGGYTWQQQSLPSPDPGISKPDYDLSFFSANKGYLYKHLTMSDKSDQSFLYVTQDGGNSWKILSSSIPSFNIVNDSYVFNEATLFTLRNGQWVAVSKPFPFPFSTIIVRFFSSLTGLALTGSGDVYQTSDGGQGWQKVGTLPAE